jgi:hypothetical protein
MSDNLNFVLASLDPPSIWDFFQTLEDAQAKQEEANTYNVKLEAHGAPKRLYEPMAYEKYKAKERDLYLSRPAEPISHERFDEMLEVLPPKNWENKGDFESFLMIEHWSGPYTQQYARRGKGDDANYWTKLVDSTDRSTWMKREGR